MDYTGACVGESVPMLGQQNSRPSPCQPYQRSKQRSIEYIPGICTVILLSKNLYILHILGLLDPIGKAKVPEPFPGGQLTQNLRRRSEQTLVAAADLRRSDWKPTDFDNSGIASPVWNNRSVLKLFQNHADGNQRT